MSAEIPEFDPKRVIIAGDCPTARALDATPETGGES